MSAVPSPRAIGSDDEQLPSSELPSTSDLLLGLQFCRANALSLTRLQLALASGDRQRALEALDKLHALDAEIEHLVQRLPSPDGAELEWRAINKHLGEQKLAIAFEKLALVSEISGPDMAAPSSALPRRESDAGGQAEWPTLPEVEPERWNSIPWQKIGALVLTMLVVAAVAAVIFYTTSS